MNVLCHPATDIKDINIVCKEKNPLFEVLREPRQWGRKGGEASNYEWRCSLTDYYIKAGRRFNQTQLTSLTVLVSTYQ